MMSFGMICRFVKPTNFEFGTTLGQLSQQNITTYNTHTKYKPAENAGLTRYNNL